MKHWTLDDIAWDRFDPSKVDPELLKVVKAAALVEKNGDTYTDYLSSVFRDDAAFCREAVRWGAEEVRHGDALGRWSELADPSFDFAAAFADFKDKIQLPPGADASVRGSRVGELIARCIVECGTSSLYAAIASHTDEPVLKQIARNIAADEVRHFKLFYTYHKRYLEAEKVGVWRRLWVALGRIHETEDDELAYAYYAANHANDGPYERKVYTRKYIARAYSIYRFQHVERATAMVFKAVGLKPRGRLSKTLARKIFRFVRWRARRHMRKEGVTMDLATVRAQAA
jgi:hypothetical protein